MTAFENIYQLVPGSHDFADVMVFLAKIEDPYTFFRAITLDRNKIFQLFYSLLKAEEKGFDYGELNFS